MAKTKKVEDKGGLDKFALILDGINKQFGDGAVMTEGSSLDIEKCSYGSLGLDLASGGGIGVGKWVEVYGGESSGKTTVLINTMIEFQKKFPGRAVAIIDFEHAFDVNYAKVLGLDTAKDRFVISQPDNGEQGFDIAEKLIVSDAFSFIGIDSIAAAKPKAEIEGESGNQTMGTHARLMGRVYPKLKGISNKHKVTMYWINQLREKIVMFGNPETTTGGNATKFYVEQRLELRKSDRKEFSEQGASGVTAKFIKNKIAPPFGVANYQMAYGKGIDRIQELVDIGVELEIIKKAGSWYSYGDTKIGQGESTVKELLEDNQELCDEIEGVIIEYLKTIS